MPCYNDHLKKRKTRSELKEEKQIINSDWFYEKVEVSRLCSDVLAINENAESELLAIFRLIDKGQVVNIAGVSDCTLKRKLRHLLKSFYLEEIVTESGGRGFKRPDKCLNFSFRECLKEVFRRVLPTVLREKRRKKNAADSEDKVENAADSEDKVEEEKIYHYDVLKKKKGPSLPTKKEVERLLDELEAKQVGPMPSSEVCSGVGTGRQLERDSWMLEAPDCLATAFGQKVKEKIDPFEVTRSAAEREEMASFMKEYNETQRGKSLREKHEEGHFKPSGGLEDKVAAYRAMGGNWGRSRHEQAVSQLEQPWKRWERESEMQSNSNVSSDQYAALIGKSKELNTRFTSSSFQNTFL